MCVLSFFKLLRLFPELYYLSPTLAAGRTMLILQPLCGILGYVCLVSKAGELGNG